MNSLHTIESVEVYCIKSMGGLNNQEVEGQASAGSHSDMNKTQSKDSRTCPMSLCEEPCNLTGAGWDGTRLPAL